MKRFFLGLLIASVLFFLGYLTGFHPVAFYLLCLFTAGICLYNLPVFITGFRDRKMLTDVIRTQEAEIATLRKEFNTCYKIIELQGEELYIRKKMLLSYAENEFAGNIHKMLVAGSFNWL